jgi:acylphosphatase
LSFEDHFMPIIHLLIKGKVQGVYYRASAKEAADSAGITGWVKNTREGHVEALASGSEADIQRFIAWCKRGPERAVVSEVIVSEGAGPVPAGFSILKG